MAHERSLVKNLKDKPFVLIRVHVGGTNAKQLKAVMQKVIQEEGSTIVLFDYDAATGRLTSRQTISTLPPGFAGSNFCSEILVSGDGRFIYAGNRLHDSIGIFSVGTTGTLTYVGEEWTRGNYPRSFNFDPTGQFLYCCNQRGDNIAVFRVDRKSGGLTFTGLYSPVGNPSIIVFLDLATSG